MALRGNLKDFSLPDVFQLVQLSGKTGVLRIVGPEAEGSIWFRDGDVFFAQSNWRREQLGERLVNAQRITPAALARALEIRSAEGEGGRRLGEILANEGYITQHVLETFVQEQIQDTIFDLMRWDEGEFDFEVLPEVVQEDIGLSVSVENIVMEGARRLEEWQRIKKKVPSNDMVFKMATAPGEGTFEISLKPIEWALLLLVDGTRSVRELATETHSTDFDVARVIYGLFSAGLLEVPADDEIERLRADRARREDKRAAFDAQRAGTEEAPAVEGAPESGLAGKVSVAPAETETRRVPEEPEFLAAGVEPPSSEDMAVFEQMMASVLAPATEAQPVPERLAEPAAEPVPEAVSEPEIGGAPAEEFTGWDFTSETESGGVTDEEVETPFVPYAPSLEPEPEPELPSGMPDIESLGFGAIPESDFETIPAPPVVEAGEVPEGPAPTGDFETDLRALGLGELPEELQAPELPTEARLPMSEIDVSLAGEEGGALPITPGPEAHAEVGAEYESVPESGGTDLDALLESLSGEEATPEGMIASDVDYGPESDASGGVISTDAFLAEFDSDAGLSGGLGDELTALTGGAGARSRPMATVAKIPEAGEGPKLHRDQMVDRSLLEQIIEGIENL